MGRAAAAGERSVWTFLFTDIERHTELWESEPAAMTTALAAQERVIVEAVGDAGGRVVKFGGDAVMAVFADPAAAVQAARTSQRALLRTEFPRIGVLRVRMGMHLGPAFERDGDYFGADVIRAARLCDTGHGGQILASAIVASLTAEESWIDLGEHELRGLAVSERVHQLTDPELPRNFPPLRSARAAHERLPRPRTSFVGRDAEVAAVQRALQAHRLVTLTGVGGCGKTRLAIAAAAAAVVDQPDGAVFVDLSTVTEDAGVFPAFASALGLESAPGATGPAGVRVRDYLARRRMLVVVDNCEHLLDEVADTVEALLDTGRDSRFLATSREPLRVEDEHVVQVGSLDPDQAAQLFAERAAIGDADHDAVARLCERLDGIPLAIELAAARTSHLSVTEIADRLQDRFRLLTGGRRRVQRQQTLQATLDWSHDLLSDDECVLLRHLAVFAGPFRLASVEAVCGADHADVVDLLGHLVDRSMVVYEPVTRRYQMLETVRLYAEQKLLDAGETDVYRRRHRDAFLAGVSALPLDGCFFLSDVSRALVPDMEDLRAALRWSVEAGDVAEAAALVVRMPAVAVLVDTAELGDYSARLVPQLPLGSELAFHTYLSGVWSSSATWSPERAPRRSPGFDTASYVRSLVSIFEGLARLAEARDDDVSAFARAMVANTLIAVALVATDDVMVQRAQELAATAVTMATSRPRSSWLGQALALSGMVALTHGDLERAAALLRDCVAAGDDDVRPVFEPTLALVLHALGDEEAQAVAVRAQGRAGLPYTFTFAVVASALELARHGEPLGARAELGSALPMLDRTPINVRSTFVIGAAGVALASRDHGRAARWLASASAVGGIFTVPAGWVLYVRYVAAVRERLPPDVGRRLRDAGRALPLDDAIAEIADWSDTAAADTAGA